MGIIKHEINLFFSSFIRITLFILAKKIVLHYFFHKI
jgi:hypothetical protein